MDKNFKRLLIIIGIILLIATIYTLIKIFKEKNNYENQIEKIEISLKEWGKQYSNYLPKKEETITITLGNLKQSGYIKSNLKNPNTKEKFSNYLLMTITKKNKEYIYDVLEESVMEDYNEINEKAPMIILKGNYIEYVELGHPYEEKGYYAFTKDGKEADEFESTIEYEGRNVSYINTNKLGTYNVTYRASYAKEFSTAYRKIIVRDTEKPVVTMNKVILKPEEVKSLDLMKGVKITDNSGSDCKVEIIGTVSPDIGKYILTYQVTDPSGNVAEKKRVVRVEE